MIQMQSLSHLFASFRQTNKCKIYLCYYGSKSVMLFSFLATNHSYFLARKCKQKRNANAANGLQTCGPVTLPYGQPLLFFSKRELKIGMSSHFLNFVFKSCQCPQMKVLNERISEWAYLML